MSKSTTKRADDDVDAIIVELKTRLSEAEERRQRVARAFLALRAVKSMARYPESAIRYVSTELQNLPHIAPSELAFEDEDTIRQMLCIHVWRILARFDDLIDAADGGPLTPVNARFLQLEGELHHGDLSVPK